VVQPKNKQKESQTVAWQGVLNHGRHVEGLSGRQLTPMYFEIIHF